MDEYEGLVADQVQVLGPDHPSTLNARTNLAQVREGAGDRVAALAESEMVLAECVRALGVDHRTGTR